MYSTLIDRLQIGNVAKQKPHLIFVIDNDVNLS